MRRLKKQKGQVTIELIVIIGVVLLFAFYFSSSVHQLVQSNKSIYLIKQNALNIISENNYPTTLLSIYSNIDVEDINFQITFSQNNGPDQSHMLDTLLYEDNYEYTLEYIENTTRFTNAYVNFEYS